MQWYRMTYECEFIILLDYNLTHHKFIKQVVYIRILQEHGVNIPFWGTLDSLKVITIKRCSKLQKKAMLKMAFVLCETCFIGK